MVIRLLAAVGSVKIVTIGMVVLGPAMKVDQPVNDRRHLCIVRLVASSAGNAVEASDVVNGF